LTTRAGGLGLTLTGADTVILYDSDWNAQVDLQAQDRAHRIGQTKPVNVYRLLTQETVVERIIRRAEQKQYLNSMVISKFEQEHQKSEKLDIISTLSFGAERIYKSNGTDISDQDVDSILKKSEEYTDKEYNVDEFEIKDENPLRLFMGEFHEKIDPKIEEEKVTGKRKRVNRITYVGKHPILTIDANETPAPVVDQKKKKRKIENENGCFICDKKSKESLYACSRCPKSYHKSW
jgi:hypothetical protein